MRTVYSEPNDKIESMKRRSNFSVYLFLIAFFFLDGCSHGDNNISHGGNKILCVSAPNGLQYTDSDARLVGAAFGRYVGFDRKNIKILSGNESTKERIFSEIKYWLSQGVSTGDLIVLFLAGHGFISEGEYYFAPQDSILMDSEKTIIVASKLISKTELTSVINLVPTKNKLLIIDTCHSGAFFKKADYSKMTPLKNARAVIRAIILPSDKTNNIEESLKSNVDFTVLAACRPEQLASEDSRLKNGILSNYLAQFLRINSWEESLFNAEEFCINISDTVNKGDWNQEVIAYGGSYFIVKLKSDPTPHFLTW